MNSSPEYEAVIGLEVHAQLLTRSKAFCGCEAAFGARPNEHVCPTCLGLPGALPVLNEEAVSMAVRAALGLGATIRSPSRFARKNYFYPDLPKGYQITQFDEPLAVGGFLEVPLAGGGTRRARIERVHMEEDAGKTIHGKGGDSIVDLNRAGTPLVEIVGLPDLRSGAEAADYLRALRDLLVFLGVNDGNLEEGSFRCDANVSIRPRGLEDLGTRVELKNINSFRFVEKAIVHEISRQEAALRSGERVLAETRGWDEEGHRTFAMRSKETAQDYRYFPDPDLPPLVLDPGWVRAIAERLPELPRDKRARFVRELGLTPYAAEVLTQHPRVAAFFEEAALLHGDPIKVANFVQGEVLRDTTTTGLSATFPLAPRAVAQLLALVDSGAVSSKQAKELYQQAVKRGGDVDLAALADALGMRQLSDPVELEAHCRRIVERNARQAEAYRSGKTGLFGFFVGQVMKETQGRANPQLANDILRRLLS